MKKPIIALAGSLVVSVVAYGGTLYVSTGGSDENDGLTSATPLKTVQSAIAKAESAIDGGETEMTIFLAAGQHAIAKGGAKTDVSCRIDKPIKLVGQGSSPSDVTLKIQYSYDWSGSYDASVVYLDNADAGLFNLTVADGLIVNWGGLTSKAAICHIQSGVVSNCVLKSGTSRGNNAHCGGVYLGTSAALLLNSRISGNQVHSTQIDNQGNANWEWSKAGGVLIDGGRMENCIVSGCSCPEDASLIDPTANRKYAGGVVMTGGSAVNCTIVGNSAYHAGGMFAFGSARIYNCVFAGNSVLESNTGAGVDDHARLWNSEFYYNCASDTVNPIRADQNCIAGTPASFFSDYANGNYVPAFGSPLIDAGLSSAVAESTDITGNARVQGTAVDIGAYEADVHIAVSLSVGTSEYGSVEGGSETYYAGESYTFTAVPNAGCMFVRWDGTAEVADPTSATVTVTPLGDCTLIPRFAPTGSVPEQHLSPDGDDGNSGYDAASPRKSIAAALETIAKSYGSGTIYLEKGTYSSQGVLVVTNAIAIVGLGDTPGDVVLKNGKGHSGEHDSRVIAIDAVGARVENLTIADGSTENYGGLISAYRSPYGGCATLYAGTISNCVVRGGYQGNWYAYAGGVYVGGEHALLTHTVIRDSQCGEKDANWGATHAGGVWISAGRMENCLVKNCTTVDPNKTDGAGGIRVTGGMVANCTVLGCSSYHTGGIYAAGGSVVNCAIGLSRHREEGGTVVPWAGGTTRFTNCAADAETAINATCIAAPADELFLGASTGDATPCFGSPLIDNGASVALSSETDLAGTARVKGSTIDIGAYEAETEIPITVTLEESDYGTTTGSGDHIAGRSLTITATPIDGYVFYCWDGNFPDEYRTQSSFTFTPSINYTAYPRFVKAGTTAVQYVKTTGSDENDGFTEETARKTIASAVACLSPTYGHGTVYVDPGTHSYAGIIKVTDPIAIVGRGASAADVVLRNSTPHNQQYDARIIEMRNAGASISGVTLKDGALTSWGASGAYIRGACATIYAGSVSNCVITGGRQNNWQTACGGIGLLSINAFMTHCVVTNCYTTMDDDNNWTTPRAGGVFIEGGRMENCLVTDCQVGDVVAALSASAGGVRLLSGSVVNCTILNCRGRYAGGINAAGGAVINTVVFGCIDRDDESISPWSGGAGRFVNCATDGETAINDTCVLITAADFRDYASGKYRPASRMALHDAGAEVSLASGTDLAGNPRVMGRGIDIGAYESQFRGFSVRLR